MAKKKDDIEQISGDQWHISGEFEDKKFDVTVSLEALRAGSPDAERDKRFYKHLIKKIEEVQDAPRSKADPVNIGDGTTES